MIIAKCTRMWLFKNIKKNRIYDFRRYATRFWNFLSFSCVHSQKCKEQEKIRSMNKTSHDKLFNVAWRDVKSKIKGKRKKNRWGTVSALIKVDDIAKKINAKEKNLKVKQSMRLLILSWINLNLITNGFREVKESQVNC